MTRFKFPGTTGRFTLNAHGKLISLDTPKLMGILNLTPDSFSDGGKYNTETLALKQAEKLVSQGADFLDLGPQSTRPGASLLSSEEETQRLGSIIKKLKLEFPQTLISVDSFYARTISYAYDQGMDLVNDISAGQFDPLLIPKVAELKIPYVLMHVNPTYETMHEKSPDPEITTSVNRFLMNKARELTALGMNDILLDPGFGFGKTQEDQEKLIEEVSALGFGLYPLMIGISRKSFIYKPLGKGPLEVDPQTQALHLKVLRQGAKLLRVHDVQSAKETLDRYLAEI